MLRKLPWLVLLASPVYAHEQSVTLAVQHLQRWEGFRTKAYGDGRQWSYGFGTRAPHRSASISRAEATRLLTQEVITLGQFIDRTVEVPLTPHQRAALICFVYNIGRTAFFRSTLREQLNRGNFAAVIPELRRWIFASGVPKLKSRREAEIRLWLGNSDFATLQPNPCPGFGWRVVSLSFLF